MAPTKTNSNSDAGKLGSTNTNTNTESGKLGSFGKDHEHAGTKDHHHGLPMPGLSGKANGPIGMSLQPNSLPSSYPS